MKKHPVIFPFLFCCIFFSTIHSSIAYFSPCSLSAKFIPADDAKEIIADIIRVIGLKPNFEVKAADIPNAAAVSYNGRRYIIYNPQFITKLNVAAGNKWASVSVLAHEVGHHLNGHTLTQVGSQPALELEADEFSGFILRKMGATLSQSQAAMKLAANYKPSHTHPGKEDRLTAIETGWNSAATPGTDMAKYSKPVPQTLPSNDGYARNNTSTKPVIELTKENRTYPSTVARNAVLDSKYILGNVNFPSDPTGNYYMTIRYNLVKIVNGQLYIVGMMRPTNNADYPFILEGKGTKTLFIDRFGKILTSKKQVAGYLKIV